jgi:integrase
LTLIATSATRKVTDASNTFVRVVEALGLNQGVTDDRQKVVFHTLRYTFAFWLAISGVPLYTISVLMGHSSMEMTKRYYGISARTPSGKPSVNWI